MNLYREAFLNIKKFSGAFWIVIIATLMSRAGNMALVFLVLYSTQYMGFTLAQAASAFAALSGSMILGGILAGNLIDYFGAVRMMIGSVMMNGIVLLIIPLTHHYYTIIFMCLLWGFFYGIYQPASQTLVSYLSAARLHKLTFSVYRLAINLGMSIGPAIGGYLATHSFPAIFITNGIANILAGLILIVGFIGSKWMMYRPAFEQKKIFTIKWLRYDAALRLFLIGMIPISMVFFQHESTLAVYLKQDLNFPLSFYGWLFTINTLMIVFFELALNVATIHWPYRVNFMMGSVFITAGFAGVYFATSMQHIVLLTVIWTIGEMILYPSASSYIADIAPEERRGSYMSLFSTFSNLGLLIGPWAGAVVMQQISNSALWIVCGLWGAISIILFYFVSEPKKKE